MDQAAKETRVYRNTDGVAFKTDINRNHLIKILLNKKQDVDSIITHLMRTITGPIKRFIPTIEIDNRRRRSTPEIAALQRQRNTVIVLK